jgi:acetyltransferase-like isoleucine patch superfamily enzyme
VADVNPKALAVRVRDRIRRERYVRPLAARSASDLSPPPPSAYKRFGRQSVIGPPCRVSNPQFVEIGDNVLIHEHAWISVVPAVEGVVPRLTIGDGTLIDRLVHIACVGEIEIGRQVLMGERVLIGDTFHEYEDVTTPVILQPMAYPSKVVIGDGSYIGLQSCIMQGVTIGEGAYVGAGTVVTSDVAPYSVVVGNPSRLVRQYDPRTGAWERPPVGQSRRDA